MKIKDTKFYKIVKPLVVFFVRILFRPTVIGLENIPKEEGFVLAGNHTKWLDPVMLVGVTKRPIHFLAKKELFQGMTKFIVKGMGCVPVNRSIRDKEALKGAMDYLKKDLCVGIFPEGTINRTNDVIMPFKIGAIKAASDTNKVLVPFAITGKYQLFRKGIQVEFLKPITISKNLEKENQKFMKIVSETIQKGSGRHG